MRGYVGKYQTKGGTRWRITYDVAPDPQTGRRRQRYRGGFRTREEAEEGLTEALAALQDGTAIEPSKATLADYLREWLAARKPTGGTKAGRGHRGKVELSTWEGYSVYVDSYIVPALGRVKLQELTPDHLDRLYDDLEENGGRGGSGLSPKTLSNLHGIIHKALTDAVRKRYLVRNVADAVNPPRPGKPETPDVWSTDQLRRFLMHVEGDRLYAAWLLFATTGMRRGEVAGLTWDDVDLDAGTLRVRQTLGVFESQPVWKPRAKSDAGQRTMSLDPATVEALRDWRRRQAEERLALGPDWHEEAVDSRGVAYAGTVFAWEDGTLIHPERWSVWFRRHTEEAGLPRVRLHDVRHAYATAALSAATGWHEVKVISERLGHASVGITLDTYSHVLPARDEETAHTLARVILGS